MIRAVFASPCCLSLLYMSLDYKFQDFSFHFWLSRLRVRLNQLLSFLGCESVFESVCESDSISRTLIRALVRTVRTWAQTLGQ